MNYTYKFHTQLNSLPENWNAVVACENILLTNDYLAALEISSPNNMEVFFVTYYQNNELIGGAVIQFLDFHKHSTFNFSKTPFCFIRNFLIKIFSANIVMLGNNMITGQNAFHFNRDKIAKKEMFKLLLQSLRAFKLPNKKTHINVLKDYEEEKLEALPVDVFNSSYQYKVQPNMILALDENWQTFDDYYLAFKKKYKARIRTARKKSEGLIKKELQLQELADSEEKIYSLYNNVALNAPFNTFFLAQNHFYEMKKNLKDKFSVYGYFHNDVLVGFYTLIQNHTHLETYFLGYDKDLQKEKQIYLNMLLDMVEKGIELKLTDINFGRTALEIKSTIGAKPQDLVGFIKHQKSSINKIVPKMFSLIEPKQEWQQRNPFR